MIFDLPAGDGPAEPGLDQLFRVLTSAAAPGELDSEGDALAMFRANFSSSRSSASAADTAVIVAGEPAQPGLPAGQRSSRGPFRWPARWAVAAAATVTLCGGMTAAAYAAVLPAPVQHLAHQVFGAVGVPDSQRQPSSPAPSGPGTHGAPAGPGANAPGSGTPAPSAAATAPGASASPAPPAAPGQLLVSVSASEITAGSSVTIDGQLLSSGRGTPGVTVRLLEWPGGRAVWHVAGTAQTNSTGNVAVTVPALTQNAVFRLAIASGAHSTDVLVRVSPPVSAVLEPGSSGRVDVLAVSTQDAHSGNVVVLEVQTAGGNWIYLRKNRLNPAGSTSFLLNGKRLEDEQVRVVLLGTPRHAASVSNQVTVPPPS